MNKTLRSLIVVTVCLVALFPLANAYANVTGFRGLEWGVEASKIPGLVLADFDKDNDWLFQNFLRIDAYPENAILERDYAQYNDEVKMENMGADIFKAFFFDGSGGRRGFDYGFAHKLFKVGQINGDKTHIGDIQITKPDYFFIDGKLSAIYFQVSGKEKSPSQLAKESQILANAFRQQYGENWEKGDICIRMNTFTTKAGYQSISITFFGYDNNKVKGFLSYHMNKWKQARQKQRNDELSREGKKVQQDL